jgi:hypothetical protein
VRCASYMAENAAPRRFCAQCGAALPVPCPACGLENETAARFCGGCGRALGERAVPEPATVPRSPHADSAERRQLTVMFCKGVAPLNVVSDRANSLLYVRNRRREMRDPCAPLMS